MLKIIPLLLAALGVVSAVSYAAPELTVTSVGQEVEIEHTNGTDDTTAWLYNNVGLAYGDWTFGLKGAKQWNYDNDDNGADKDGKGVSSKDSRLDLEAWRKINDDLKLGLKYRGHDEHARYIAMYNYNHGMFFSTGDFWYQVNENGNDTLRAEWFPIGVKIGPVTAKYLVDYTKATGERAGNDLESSIEHQLRIAAPLYKWDRLSLSTEARITLHAEEDHVKGGYQAYEDFGRNRLYLKANYAVSESLNVYVNYAYELREREERDGGNGKALDNADYQNLTFGWSYSF